MSDGAVVPFASRRSVRPMPPPAAPGVAPPTPAPATATHLPFARLDGPCVECGASIRSHYGADPNGGLIFIGHPHAPQPGLPARLLERATRALPLAGAIAAALLGRGVDEGLAALPPARREQIRAQALRALAEHDATAVAVARYRAIQAAVPRVEELLLGHGRVTAEQREIVALVVDGALEAYAASLEGRFGEAQPEELTAIGRTS